ncbi:MAG: transcriptional regulator NrdR [Candidatus Woesearchaeota archaeon]
MKCPFCHSDDNKVLDKRESNEGKITRRRRECLGCKKRFTTYERIESHPIIVVKKNKNREQFDRYKLKRGIQKSCEKRPVSDEQIEKIIDQIETELKNRSSSEIKSKEIGEMVMEKLKDIDEVSFVRFASVYRHFKDIKTFEKELKKLLKK